MFHFQKNRNIRWLLVLYDCVLYLLACVLMFVLHPSTNTVYTLQIILAQSLLGFLCIFGMRAVFSVYGQIWRYGGVSSFIRLFAADILGEHSIFCLTICFPSATRNSSACSL